MIDCLTVINHSIINDTDVIQLFTAVSQDVIEGTLQLHGFNSSKD